MGFAGAYVPMNASLSFKALAGLSINGSVASSIDSSWTDSLWVALQVWIIV